MKPVPKKKKRSHSALSLIGAGVKGFSFGGIVGGLLLVVSGARVEVDKASILLYSGYSVKGPVVISFEQVQGRISVWSSHPDGGFDIFESSFEMAFFGRIISPSWGQLTWLF